jgi:hypothetical protein
MKLTDLLANTYYGIAIGVVVVTASKFFYGWFRGDQISKRFIIDMASVHLPYIYRELKRQNPESPEHPNIVFMNFKDK